mmetsp:Transcript_106327/g.184818  ORF Transcript_106327/g.184818 Transcript_106327/m.184818 type:complete len:611 (-) Transcript_106327:98-1930(-)
MTVGSLGREVTLTSDFDEDDVFDETLPASLPDDDVESSCGPPLPVPKRALTRGLAVVFVFAAFIAVFTHGVMYHKRRISSRAAPKMFDGLVEWDVADRAPVAPWIKPKPDLCNVGVVLDICLRLNGQSPEYLDFDPKSPKASVSASTLSSYFMASTDSVVSFLKSIGAADVSEGGDDYTVKCEQMCMKTVASFATGQLPPMVDVGCYLQPPAMEPTCSVDLSLSSLMHTGLPKGSEEWRKEFLEDAKTRLTDSELKEVKTINSEKSKKEWQALAYPSISFEQLQLQAARLFRMFPASKKVSLDLTSSVSIARKLWDDSCATANDGKCDVPFSCADGTDCTDCGTCEGRVPQDTCVYHNDQFCDEPRYCLVGTDCSDCDSCGWGGDELEKQLKKTKPNDSCVSAKDGSCDPSCEEGTDCTDCNTCHYSGSHFTAPQYPDEVLGSATKAQGLIAIALIGLQSGGGGDVLMELIGKDDTEVRTELKRAITGLSRLLDNVNYVFPGPECEGRTLGYVDAEKVPAAGEPYTMNLCKMFMDGNDYEHLVTLLETGLHSAPMLTEKVKLDGEYVYDLAMVKKLAKTCKASGGDACTKAIRNAQSIMYVIDGFAKCSL